MWLVGGASQNNVASLGRRQRGLLACLGRNPVGALLSFLPAQREVNTFLGCAGIPPSLAPAAPPAARASGPWPVVCCPREGRAQRRCMTHPGSEQCVVAGTLCQAASCPSA